MKSHLEEGDAMFLTAQENERQVVEVGALEAIIKAELDIAITTARAYPREMKTARKKLLSLATTSRATAETCFYAVPRGGKPIRGPSIRLAEMLAASYGNIKVGVRIIDITEQHVVAQAICHDLENNVMVAQEVRRSIVGKNGRKYSPDMITVTSQAACSIAFRNAVFKAVPFGLFAEEIGQIEKIGLGEERDLPESRAAMLAWFDGQGIEESRILDMFGKAAVEDVDLEDIGLLRGVCNAIQTGEITAEEAFKDFGARTSDSLKKIRDKLDEKRKGKGLSKMPADTCASWAVLYEALNGKGGSDRVHSAFKDAKEEYKKELDGVKSLNDIDKDDESRAELVLEFLKEG